jgi:hypothetical protein
LEDVAALLNPDPEIRESSSSSCSIYWAINHSVIACDDHEDISFAVGGDTVGLCRRQRDPVHSSGKLLGIKNVKASAI